MAYERLGIEIENWYDTSGCNCKPGKLDNCWRKRWSKKFHEDKNYMPQCSEENCSKDGTDGAHVRKKGGWKTYIIPLCNYHNKQYNEYLVVTDDTQFLALKGCEHGRSYMSGLRSGSRKRNVSSNEESFSDCCIIL